MLQNVFFIIPPRLPIIEFKAGMPTKIVSHPLGVLSLAAYIRAHTSVQIKILDFNLELETLIEPGINLIDGMRKVIQVHTHDFSPDVIGISALFTSNAGYMTLLSGILKELWPDAIVVTGGGLPTNMPREVFDWAPGIDAIAIGEGEKPLLGLLNAKDKKAYLEVGKGWTTRLRLKNHEIPATDFIEDLDEIPFFAFDLLQFEDYLDANRFHGSRTENPIIAQLMTTRGCPYRCVFCASHTVHGKKIRSMSVQRVIEDINRFIREYHVNVFSIEDDLMLVNKPFATAILEHIAQQKVKVEFTNGMDVASISEDMIRLFKKAGVEMATLAIESGSERVLKMIIHKQWTDLNKVRDVVALLRKHNIYIRSFFIIGFPGETKADIQESINFMKSVGFNWVGIMIATPLVGSELYKICKDNNYLISDNIEEFHFAKANIRTPDFEPSELVQLRYHINLDVNFVENYDLCHGTPETALLGFEDVIFRIPNHAFAHYFSHKAYNMLDQVEKAKQSYNMYKKSINESEMWMGYAKEFGLPTI